MAGRRLTSTCLKCPHCGHVNKITTDRMLDALKVSCGKCGRRLADRADDEA